MLTGSTAAISIPSDRFNSRAARKSNLTTSHRCLSVAA
jgi:hypothetical protein